MNVAVGLEVEQGVKMSVNVGGGVVSVLMLMWVIHNLFFNIW